MSRRTVFYIVAVAVLLHAGVFLYFGGMQALPKTRYVPRPNFGLTQEVYHDANGQTITYREFRVSTKLADPAMLKRIEEQRSAAAAKAEPPPP